MEQKYNLRSPAVKRLMREAKELCESTEQYFAQPLEDNLFEWHFTVQGPADSDFEAGRYHGRITLPPEYPMKPPSIMLLTPNGRFETGRKICLSMSAHHPETWQPSWSIRTVLLAIIGFMPTKGGGAIGALDYTTEERKVLAKKSMQWKCNVCNSCNANSLKEAEPGSERKTNKEIEELAGQITFKGENETKTDGPSTPQSAVTSVGSYSDESLNTTTGDNRTPEFTQPPMDGETPPTPDTEQDKSSRNVRKRSSKRSSSRRSNGQNAATHPPAFTRTADSAGYLTTFLIVLIVTCLIVLFLRRISYNYFYTEST